MKKKCQGLGWYEWGVIDVTKLELGDASVDFAVDKGTLDALIHRNLWDPPMDGRRMLGLMLIGVFNVMFEIEVYLLTSMKRLHKSSS